VSDAYTKGTSMMDRYASWNFGRLGNNVMAAPADTHMGDIIGWNDPQIPDRLKKMTVGAWKDARRALFPDNPAGGAGGNTVITVAPSTLHIVIDPTKAAVHTRELEWAHTTEAPTPHGAATGPVLPPRPRAPRRPVAPAPPPLSDSEAWAQ
jgi:aspartate/glutamate racemase